MSRQRPILWQFFPSFLIITVIVMIITAWGVTRINRQHTIRILQSNLKTHRHFLHSYLKNDPTAAGSIPALRDFIRSLNNTPDNSSGIRITFFSQEGRILIDSDPQSDRTELLTDTREFQLFTQSETTDTFCLRYDPAYNRKTLFYLVPSKEFAPNTAYLRLGLPFDPGETLPISQLFPRILYMVLLIGLVLAVMSFLVAWQINRPIQSLIRTADRVASGNLGYWSEGSSRIREFHALTQALKSMARQLNERLRNETRQRNELEAMFGSMVEAVLVIDSNECILRCNHAAAELFHTEKSNLSGKSILEVIRNSDLHRFVRKTLCRNIPQEEDIIFHNHEDRYVRATGTAIEDSDNTIIGALIVLHDVTQIHKLERIRKDFVANVSHELKTPVTTIKGFVETLLDGAVDDPDNALRFLKIILKNANQLHAVIEDLLSLSRIEQETGNGKILFTSEKIRDIIQSVLQICEVKARERNIRIDVTGDTELIFIIHRTLMQQALVNLVDNALKYGGDTCTIHIDTVSNTDCVKISVEDNGPGISPEHHERLFERFYRVDKSRSRDLGGSGLGLAIVKHIVQAHGGSISVSSQPGEGTVFTMTLPRKTAP